MYKAVFSDFDGTLLTSQHTISPRTVVVIIFPPRAVKFLI